MGASSEKDPSGTDQATESASAEKTEGETKATPRKVRGHVFINEERCKGCGLCIAFCPSHVLIRSERFNTKGYHPPGAHEPDSCTGCDICGYFCPDFAIYGVRITDKQGSNDKKP